MGSPIDRIPLSSDQTRVINQPGLDASPALLASATQSPYSYAFNNTAASYYTPGSATNFSNIYTGDRGLMSGQRSIDMPPLAYSLPLDSQMSGVGSRQDQQWSPEPMDPRKSLTDLVDQGTVEVVKRAADNNIIAPETPSKPTLQVDYCQPGLDRTSDIRNADIRVLRDGTIQCSPDLEDKLRTGIVVVHVEQAGEGQTAAEQEHQKAKLDQTVQWLGRRMQQTFSTNDVEIADSRQLVSPAVKDMFTTEIAKDVEIPEQVQNNVRQGATMGSRGENLSPDQQEHMVPPRIPVAADETPLTRVIKDTIASEIFPQGETNPYMAITQRMNGEMGIGRYAISWDLLKQLDWFSGCLPDDPDEPIDTAKINKMVKSHKMTAATAKILTSHAFRVMAHKLRHHEKPTDTEIRTLMTKPVQEFLAGKLIEKFDRDINAHDKNHDPSKVALSMMLGRVPTDKDLKDSRIQDLLSDINHRRALNENRLENPKIPDEPGKPGSGKPGKYFYWKDIGGIPVTSPFGDRDHPILHKIKHHDGIDIGGREGQPVHAAGAGTLVSKGWVDGFGNCVKLEHTLKDGSRVQTIYGHMQGFSDELNSTRVGGSVCDGMPIGREGSTGRSTGPHLHFGVMDMRSHTYVDPMKYLQNGELSAPMLRGET